VKISEALDELRTGILRDEALLAEGPDDHLWQDTSIIRYMNFIQNMWARKTLTLRDSTTTMVTQVTLVEGTAQYILHKAVRTVLSARYDTNTVDLKRASHPVLAQSNVVDSDYFDINSVGVNTPGVPLAFTTDEGLDLATNASVTLRVFPTPSAEVAGKKLYLRVARMPLNVLALTALSATFEIPEEYHLSLLDGVAWRCYLNDDRDGASAKADACKARFDAAMLEAAKEQRAKMYQPTNWAFGRNGFTWSP
jgi:hypothetical protein